MATYTTQIETMCKEICKNRLNLNLNELNVNQIIEYARPFIFDFAFPIFDENYRDTLETKILKHFYFREIGQETPAQFKFMLDESLNLEMPSFNEYYRSAVLKFNPLYNVDYTKTHEGTIEQNREGTEQANLSQTENSTETGTGKESAVAKGKAENMNDTTVRQSYSDTPQNGIEDVDENRYLTTYQKNASIANDTNISESQTIADRQNTNTGKRTSTGNNTVNRNENANTTDNYIETVKGNMGGSSFSGMLIEFRKSIINVDKMIMDMLEPLFMGIY